MTDLDPVGAEQLAEVVLQLLVLGRRVLVALAQLAELVEEDLQQPHADHRHLRLVLRTRDARLQLAHTHMYEAKFHMFSTISA